MRQLHPKGQGHEASSRSIGIIWRNVTYQWQGHRTEWTNNILYNSGLFHSILTARSSYLSNILDSSYYEVQSCYGAHVFSFENIYMYRYWDQNSVFGLMMPWWTQLYKTYNRLCWKIVYKYATKQITQKYQNEFKDLKVYK